MQNEFFYLHVAAFELLFLYWAKENDDLILSLYPFLYSTWRNLCWYSTTVMVFFGWKAELSQIGQGFINKYVSLERFTFPKIKLHVDTWACKRCRRRYKHADRR